MADPKNPFDDPQKAFKWNMFHMQYLPMVKRNINKLKNEGRITPEVDVGDLHEAAHHGLMKALHKYDRGRGIPFPAYASRTIYDHMRTALSKGDPVPQKVRQQAKALRSMEAQKPKISSAQSPQKTEGDPTQE